MPTKPRFWGGFPPKTRSVLRNRQGIPRLSRVSSRARSSNAPAGASARRSVVILSITRCVGPSGDSFRSICSRKLSPVSCSRVSIVDYPVEDGVGQGRLAEHDIALHSRNGCHQTNSSVHRRQTHSAPKCRHHCDHRRPRVRPRNWFPTRVLSHRRSGRPRSASPGTASMGYCDRESICRINLPAEDWQRDVSPASGVLFGV